MRRLWIAAVIASLTGCGNMSGVSGQTDFACKAPPGVTCSSLSGVYANAVANNLPGLRKDVSTLDKKQSEDKPRYQGSKTPITGEAQLSGRAIRTQAKVLRIWIAPWEDSEGDLHDQAYTYVVVDPGRWAIEHNHRQIVDQYRPVFVKQTPVKATLPATSQQPVVQPITQQGGINMPGTQIYSGEQTGVVE